MISNQSELADYLLKNQARLGPDGMMIAKALFQTMENPGGLNWSQIDQVVTNYNTQPEQVDWLVGIAQGILAGFLYPYKIFGLLRSVK